MSDIDPRDCQDGMADTEQNEVERLRARVAELEADVAEIPQLCRKYERQIAALKAGQGGPYGWYDTECGQMFFERHERKPETEIPLYTSAPSIPDGWLDDWMGRHGFSLPIPAYKEAKAILSAVPSIPDGYIKAVEACSEFVRKVECGEARSTRSYAQMKAALKMLSAAPQPAPAPNTAGDGTD